MIELPTYSRATQVLALQRFGHVTPRLFAALFQRFETIEQILMAEIPALIEMEGLTESSAKKISGVYNRLPEASKLAEAYLKRDIHLVSRFDENYPPLLEELNDPPSLLFVRGQLPDPKSKSVTLVGAENATAEGIEFTTRVARGFTEKNVQIVSSMVGGVDYAAHLAVRAAGKPSYSVIESGFDHLEQEGHIPLAIDLADSGGVISEYLPESKRTPGAVAETNRMLVGLTQAVVVTELYHDSARTMDLLQFCNMIGKMAFILIDSTKDALIDERAFAQAASYGALPLDGLDKIDAIAASLV